MNASSAVDVERLDLPLVSTNGAEYEADPPAIWRKLRERHWLARTEFGVSVLPYRHNAELLQARELTGVGDGMLTMQGISSGPLYDWWTRGLLSAMPKNEQHHRLRRLQTPSFTPNKVERMRAVIRETAERLVSEFVAEGRCDFVAQFAHQYPVEIIARMMGIPRGDIPQFSRWSTDVGLSFAFPVAPVRLRAEAAVTGLIGYIRDLIARRRADPGDDVLSHLIAAEGEGDRLSDDELPWQAVNLIVGGHDVARSQLAFVVRLLAEHPEPWDALAADPALTAGAIEEGMRLHPVIPYVARQVVKDFEYEGVRFPQGFILMLRFDSANRDPGMFPEPDRFDPRRANAAASLSFSGGSRHCMGVHLARAEMREALPILARAMPGLRLDGPGQWRPNSAMLLGPESMPVRFETPGHSGLRS